MFINPKLIATETLENLVRYWLTQQDIDSSSDYEIDSAVSQVITKLKNKSLVLTYSENESLDEIENWSIQPCEAFNLTPSKVVFD